MMYVELKSNTGGGGPAWITRVEFSKSGRSVWFRGRELRNIGGRGARGNYLDVQSGEEYWVSGVKRRGSNRHWSGGGAIEIDPSVHEEYKAHIGGK